MNILNIVNMTYDRKIFILFLLYMIIVIMAYIIVEFVPVVLYIGISVYILR